MVQRGELLVGVVALQKMRFMKTAKRLLLTLLLRLAETL
jgi:hypothetical protein